MNIVLPRSKEVNLSATLRVLNFRNQQGETGMHHYRDNEERKTFKTPVVEYEALSL